MTARVRYDEVAPDYDRRFRRGGLPGIERGLRRAAVAAGARRALELGCGTGHWLPAFGTPSVVGADRSLGMLARAGVERRGAALLAADAGALPFSTAAFDLVAVVNALHHFDDPRRSLASAAALLREGGALLVIGLDPSAGRDRWYLYDYFPDTLPADLERYPAHAAIRRWMRELGLQRVTTRIAQRIQSTYAGAAVLDDPILHRHGTSQLTLLGDTAFEQGMARIRDAVARPGEPTRFDTDLILPLTRGFARSGRGDTTPSLA